MKYYARTEIADENGRVITRFLNEETRQTKINTMNGTVHVFQLCLNVFEPNETGDAYK